MANQLYIKEYSDKKNIFPKNYTDNIRDKESNKTLTEILQGFNCYFLSYTGNVETTRLQVPKLLRKQGLWITYVDYENNTITEYYDNPSIEDYKFKDSSNWRKGNNKLVGDLSISANGNWVINGVETEFKAQGEAGTTPLIRLGDNNKFQVSYNKGNKWDDISGYIEPTIRMAGASGNSIGHLELSMDKGTTWTSLSGDIVNNLKISKYIGIYDDLPTSGVKEGTIYMKGPYYDENDTNNDNPIYRMWVYAWKGDTLAWVDNGEFTSIIAGIVNDLTTGGADKALSAEMGKELGIIDMATTRALGIEAGYTKLIDGYIDGSQSVLPTPTSSTSLRHIIIDVQEGELYTVQSVGRNLGYLYILYDNDNNRVGYFPGTNNTVITIGVTIPSGVVKMAVNCDSAYTDKFLVFKQNKGAIVSTQFGKSEVLLPSQKMVSDSLQASYPWVKSYNNLPSPSSLSIVKDIWFEGIDGEGIPSELGSTIIPILRTINQEGTGYAPIFLGLVKEGEIAYYKGCSEMYRDDSYYIGRITLKYENIRCNAYALLDITALQGSETILASGVALTNMVEVLVKDKSLLSLPNVDIKGISSKLSELNDKVLLLESEIFEKEIYYTKDSLSRGYCDITKTTLQQPNTDPSYVKHILISDLREGSRYIITSARYNNGYVYGLYDKNGNRIKYYAGDNHVVETVELVIPSDAATLAINCDAALEDSFSVISSKDSLSSRVERLEELGGDVEELSAKNRIVWTLGSSTIDLMKTTTNADGVKDWSYLGQLLGAKKLYNIGIGGSTWQTQGIDTDTPDINNTATRSASNQIKMLKRLVDSGNYEYPEIIFLQFTNGYSVNGTITDNMEQVMAMSFEELEANTNIRKTFYGGVRYALELLNRYFPKATYYVSDGIQCDRDLPYRRGYEYVKSGRDALKKMCDRYSCPFLETSRSIGIVDLYEHGSKTSTSNIEVLSGATASGTIVLSLKDNNIDVSVTEGDTPNVVAQKIANAVNSSNIGWAATLNDSKVLLSVAKESAAVPEFNAASTGVSVDITFNQFADDYDGIYLSTDGLHPNEKGKKLIARCVAKSINETYFQKQ